MATAMVRQALRPRFYDHFRCLAADCRIDCCRGWRIHFDKKDYLTMRNARCSPALRERLDTGMKRIRDDGAFYAEFQAGSDCPLHREDGLCALQAELGHGALPKVCRTFPRAEKLSVSGYLERSLSPACEAVLGLLWELPEGIDFVADPLPHREQMRLTLTHDHGMLVHYGDIRALCVDILQDRRMTVAERLMFMGLRLHELKEDTDVPRWLAATEGMLASPEVPAQMGKTLAQQPGAGGMLWLTNMTKELMGLNAGHTALRQLRRELTDALGLTLAAQGTQIDFAVPSTAPYIAARSRFQEVFGDREYFFENLMVAVFFHLGCPNATSGEALWKSYVNICHLYAFYRFMAALSCREGVEPSRDELFRCLVFASRCLLHNQSMQTELRDRYFENDSATLAHMAILLGR